MRILIFIVSLLLANATALTGWGADLTKIDRTIAKEPAYKSKPKYCLLVFGPEAKTRVWLALDGNVLYVDRNGNGDLTEKGERFAGAILQGGHIHWSIGDIMEADGKTRHTGLGVRFDPEQTSFILWLKTSQKVHQEVGNEVGRLRFADKASAAPIVHFAGPLTFLIRNRSERPWQPILIPGKEADFHFIALIGTAGLGEGAAAYSHHEDFESLQMVCKVEFPRQAPGAPLRVRGKQTFY
jgi:hypothetical protein